MAGMEVPRLEVGRLIRAFEAQLGTRVCIYDYLDVLHPIVPQENTYHSHAYCRHAIHELNQCAAFEHGTAMKAKVAAEKGGFFKRCHARVWEAVAPVRWQGELAGVAMAGLARLSMDEEAALERKLTAEAMPLWDGKTQHLFQKVPPRGAEQMEQALELLRALAARLEDILETSGERGEAQRDRRWIVEHFIGRRYASNIEIADLAIAMGVSRSRARHVVKEMFGKNFSELVNERRLEQAKVLLLQSELPVTAIAERCGFGEPSNFFRFFKAREGITPRRFREENELV